MRARPVLAVHELDLVAERVRRPDPVRHGYVGGLDDARVVLGKRPQPAAGPREHPRAPHAVGRRRLLLLRVLVLDPAEQAGHPGEAGADDPGVELNEGPQGEVGVVVGRVRGRRPRGQEPQAGDGADGDEKPEEEHKDDADLGLPVRLKLQPASASQSWFSRPVWTPSAGLIEYSQLRDRQEEDEYVEDDVHGGADPGLCRHVDTLAVHATVPPRPDVAKGLAVTQQRHDKDEAEARDEGQQGEAHVPEALLGEDPEI